jgi:hypothetical protein
MTTLADGSDVQPDPTETVKLYVPVERFVIVVLVPVPVIEPGLIVQVPVEGNPFNTTLPVGDAHDEGWVRVPAVGADGPPGSALITTLALAVDPLSSVIVTL